MKRIVAIVVAALSIAAAAMLITHSKPGIAPTSPPQGELALPEPAFDGGLSLEQTLYTRRSRRSYANRALALSELSQVLWAAAGLNKPSGRFRGRTVPSAGALYPLEVYVAVRAVDGLAPGVYLYRPASHSLQTVRAGEVGEELAKAALGQKWVKDAPANIVIAAVYNRTMRRYGERTARYVHTEVGHCGQNVYLQAESLGLGTVAIGAFDDEQVWKVLSLPEDHKPLYIMPLGARK